MKRSAERILTTHVGSLARPDALVPILTAKDRGQPYDREAYARLVREAVADVVRRQTDAGVDVVTDGQEWATLALDLPASTAAVEVFHSSVLPSLESQPDRVEHHHSVEETLRNVPSTGGVAVLMPAIDFDTVNRIVGGDRLLPEKATSFQPKPSVGVLMRSLRDG